MFRHIGVSLSCAFVLLSYFLFLFLLPLTKEDKAEYNHLLQQSLPEEQQLSPPHKGTQQRTEVIKNIWHQDLQRLHFRLSCDSSTLEFDLSADSSDVLEKMYGVDCLMQEEIFYLLPDGREVKKDPSGGLYLITNNEEDEGKTWVLPEEEAKLKPFQKIRKLEAKEATYYFATGLFKADEVILKRYIVEGHNLPLIIENVEPEMRGVAKSVSFALSGKFLNFKAKHLKATFFTPDT
jgi:hypothetical protein